MSTPRLGSRDDRSHWLRLTRILGPLLFALVSAPASYAAPLLRAQDGAEPEPLPADDASLWAYLGTAVALVLFGGVFAGLTIAYVDFYFRGPFLNGTVADTMMSSLCVKSLFAPLY